MTELPNVTIGVEDGIVVANLTGEIDLSDVSYLDSAGVRMLAELDHRLGWRAQALRVVAPEASRSRRVLAIAGLERVLSLETSIDAARTSIEGSDQEPELTAE